MKEFICTTSGKIVKLSKYNSIELYPNGMILGFYDDDNGIGEEELFKGSIEGATHIMELIKEVLCIDTHIPEVD